MTGAMVEQVFRLPDLGEGLTEAEVVSWRVAEGDTVRVDQVVVEVETAKALVEVPIPYAGTVLRLHAQAGTPLSVGEPLISVGASSVAADVYREEEQAGSGNVLIGYGTGHAPTSRRRSRAARPEASAPASTPGAPLVISPLVRKLAKDNGIDVARLTPTGSHGVLLRRDVEQALTPADTTRIPLTGLRRTVAEKLSRSRSEIPDATTWVDVDATALMAAKAEMQGPERKTSLLALLVRCCVAGLRRFPALNSTVDTARAEIVQHHHVHLGFAAQTDRGLMVPVVHDADRMTTTELSAELARLTDLARAGSLPPASLTGGTFTLNNYGVFGVDGSTPIINHPEAGLLGVGRIVDKPWAVNGELAVRKVTQLSLTFDHRVCDGGVAGGFLRFVADCVERPIMLLGEI
jgi:pyruvate dehydrogenase E2 component (dihydrolipoamide acetyltransferase)